MVLFSVVLSFCIGAASAASDASTTIWFGKPGNIWTDALPVGNGRLGAVVHGGYRKELIGLNEDSIWSGGLQRRVSPKSATGFPLLKQAFDDGNITEADRIWRADLTGNGTSVRQYQPAGDLMIDFGTDIGTEAAVTNYNRSLDLATGISLVNYVQKNTMYWRRAVASHPDDILGFSYDADRNGSLNMDISLSRKEGMTGIEVDLTEQSITVWAEGTNGTSLKFAQQIRIEHNQGNITANETAIMIRNSRNVKIWYNAETTYRHADVNAAQAAMEAKLDAVVGKDWDTFTETAVEDYQSLAGRVVVDVGTSGDIGRKDTATRLENWKNNGNATSDPELLALTYNYGRFLLLSSSRMGTLPANLQGIWNDKFVPPWGSRYTININAEMNYWPAETTNLAETHFPVFDLLEKMQEQGRYAARGMYNASGWVCHHNTDLWGDCVPVDDQTYWAANPVGGAWLALHLIEHFYFSGNKTFVTEKALPILSDALAFFYDFSIERDGYFVLSYDSSPENSYVIPEDKRIAGNTTGIDQGSVHARQVLYELFDGFIKLSEAVGSTDGVEKAKEYLSKIELPQIGARGQLMEWSEDYEETEPAHRHLSHLLAAYPGAHISPLINKTVSDAALKALDLRIEAAGAENVGWSKVWAAGIYARLFEGDKAGFHLCDFIANYLAGNLFDLNIGVFQIDGNLGFTGSMTEIFLQSHAGIVHLAPALPSNIIPTGSVSGLVARGGFLVDVAWKNHRFMSANITSQRGEDLKLLVENGTKFMVNGVSGNGSTIQTLAGFEYFVTV